VSLLDRAALPAGGRAVERYRVEAGSLALEVMTLGATVTSLRVPDRAGRAEEVVLAHERPEDCAGRNRDYFGATIGRVANRIAYGRYVLDGREHRLACNDGRHHLHGGIAGFDRQDWHVVRREEGAAATIAFGRTSCDGEEGYPGELRVRVTYTVRPEGDVRICYEAITDAPTIVNLTNHAYFNLRGAGRGDVLGHELWLAADRFLPVDEELIPSGEIRPVAGSPFDFRETARIGSRIGAVDPQLQRSGGFDHCMVLPDQRDAAGTAVRHAATLCDPESGRRLEFWTDQPAVQLYSGNFLDGSAVGPGGHRHLRHGGVCLETQDLPDAPNRPQFPSIRLDPGQRYTRTTVWRSSPMS
jgi:aldose 1-epimerase